MKFIETVSCIAKTFIKAVKTKSNIKLYTPLFVICKSAHNIALLRRSRK